MLTGKKHNLSITTHPGQFPRQTTAPPDKYTKTLSGTPKQRAKSCIRIGVSTPTPHQDHTTPFTESYEEIEQMMKKNFVATFLLSMLACAIGNNEATAAIDLLVPSPITPSYSSESIFSAMVSDIPMSLEEGGGAPAEGFFNGNFFLTGTFSAPGAVVDGEFSITAVVPPLATGSVGPFINGQDVLSGTITSVSYDPSRDLSEVNSMMVLPFTLYFQVSGLTGDLADRFGDRAEITFNVSPFGMSNADIRAVVPEPASVAIWGVVVLGSVIVGSRRCHRRR